MITEHEGKRQLIEAGKRLYEHNLLSATEGSMTLKLNEHEYLCTASGTNKGMMDFNSFCKVDESGKLLKASPVGNPTGALNTHLLLHKLRPEMDAIIHAYPMNALTYATAGIPLTMPTTLAAINILGCVPCIAHGLPSSEEEWEILKKVFPYYDTFLFSDIGCFTGAENLFKAVNLQENVEMYATLTKNMASVLSENSLTLKQVQEMMSTRGKKNATKHPKDICIRTQLGLASCHGCVEGKSEMDMTNLELIKEITNRVLVSLK